MEWLIFILYLCLGFLVVFGATATEQLSYHRGEDAIIGAIVVIFWPLAVAGWVIGKIMKVVMLLGSSVGKDFRTRRTRY